MESLIDEYHTALEEKNKLIAKSHSGEITSIVEMRKHIELTKAAQEKVRITGQLALEQHINK